MDELKARNELLDITEKVCRREGLGSYEITEVKTNPKGEGFVGQIFFVTVKDKVTKKDLSLILKCAFQDAKIRATVPIKMCFENEVLFYSTIFPAFLAFEENCCGEKSADLVPMCHEVTLQPEAEIVVLQNLKPLGFECFEKRDLLDHDHVKMIFEAYGRYHAYSFAYKDQHPEEFARLASRSNSVQGDISKNDSFMKMFEGSVEQIKGFFCPGKDDEVLGKLKKYEGPALADVFRSSLAGDCDHSVIVHGDCWSNNMMFKYERINGQNKLKEMRIIDWQLIQLASPICDLSYFLYSGSSREIFDKLDDYLKIYHETLSSSVKRLGTSPEKVFSFSVLKDHWRRYAKFGITMATMIQRVKVTYKDEVADFTDLAASEDCDISDVFTKSGFDEELYRKRMVDLFQHASEIGAL